MDDEMCAIVRGIPSMATEGMCNIENVKLSFEGPEGTFCHTIIHNPRILPAALRSQVLRFGLLKETEKRPQMAGKLNSSQKAFTEMIKSYGLGIEMVRIGSV